MDSLAAYRLTRLMTEDEITEPARSWVAARCVESERPGVTRQPWAFMRDLLGCPWCSGIWAGFAVLLLPRWVRRALALAALAGIVSEREAAA